MLAGCSEAATVRVHLERRAMKLMSKSTIDFVQAFLAVLGGNVLYFLLENHLPVRARHVIFRVDLGMVVDFWFCLAVFGAIKTIARWKSLSKPDKP